MKMRFWTQQEKNRLIEMSKSYTNRSKLARILSKEINRSPATITVMLGKLVGNKQKPAKITTKQIQLPQGFEFNFVPKRAVMQKDSVTLYF